MIKRLILLATILMGCSAWAEQPSQDPLADGISLVRKGQIEPALVLLRRAIAIAPDSAPAHNYYGFALARSGSLTPAIQEFQEAIQLDAKYPDALYNLGTALSIQEKYSAAVDALKQAIALKPGFPEALFELGNGLAAQTMLAAQSKRSKGRYESDRKWAKLGLSLQCSIPGWVIPKVPSRSSGTW